MLVFFVVLVVQVCYFDIEVSFVFSNNSVLKKVPGGWLWLVVVAAAVLFSAGLVLLLSSDEAAPPVADTSTTMSETVDSSVDGPSFVVTTTSTTEMPDSIPESDGGGDGSAVAAVSLGRMSVDGEVFVFHTQVCVISDKDFLVSGVFDFSKPVGEFEGEVVADTSLNLGSDSLSYVTAASAVTSSEVYDVVPGDQGSSAVSSFVVANYEAEQVWTLEEFDVVDVSSSSVYVSGVVSSVGLNSDADSDSEGSSAEFVLSVQCAGA